MTNFFSAVQPDKVQAAAWDGKKLSSRQRFEENCWKFMLERRTIIYLIYPPFQFPSPSSFKYFFRGLSSPSINFYVHRRRRVLYLADGEGAFERSKIKSCTALYGAVKADHKDPERRQKKSHK
jgi:hypothetical protein